MNSSVQTYLENLLERVDGLQAVLVSDRDGVELIKVANPSYVDNSLAASIVKFTMAHEQASKVRLGKNQSITAMYNDHMTVHIAHSPLVVTLVAKAEANAGLLLGMTQEIKRALDPIKMSIE